MNLYPVMINIEDKLVTVVGGGKVAFRKIKDLADAGAGVKVISPEIDEEIYLLSKKTKKIEIIRRKYITGDMDGSSLVFAATDDEAINRNIYEEASEKNILVNSADDPSNCSFYVPSMLKRGDLIVAVSTAGSSPAMAARLRREIENNMPENIEDILSSLKEARAYLKNIENLSSEDKGIILKKIVNDDSLLDEIVQSRKENKISEFLRIILQASL